MTTNALKNTVFSALLLLSAVMITLRMIPPSVDGVIALTLSKNKTHISRIDQPRHISQTRKLMIDRVELHHNNRFAHPKLGPLGWGEDFFADVNTDFHVDKRNRYRFLVGSDDGFSLRIDGKLLCRHRGDRPFSKQGCYKTLAEGAHHLALHYFQGYGNAGLTLQAGLARNGQLHYWGEDIAGIAYRLAK